MMNFDTAEGVLRFAIGREVEANVFYNLLTQFVDDPQVRALCSELAFEELELMKLGNVGKLPLVG